MANTKRRYIDKNGNTFVPMDVAGGSWNEHFMTTPKIICLLACIVGLVIVIIWAGEQRLSFAGYLIVLGIYLFITQFIVRYVILEERAYYKMYLEMKEHEVDTPALFWDIISIKETADGAIMTYGDAKIGIIVKLERDTITGKKEEFREEHYDAISEFYRELVTRRYSFVQMNMMENAGNNSRLSVLDKLVNSGDNENINKLMEGMVGHLKNINRKTLYETDYILIYSENVSRIDDIIDDSLEAIYKILDGNYVEYRILRAKDIIDIVKEQYGVKYFNYNDAIMNLYNTRKTVVDKPFKLLEIVYTDGEVQELGDRERNKVNRLTSDVLKGALNVEELSIKKALKVRKSNNSIVDVDFNSSAETYEDITLNENKDKDENDIKTSEKKEGEKRVSFLGRRSDIHKEKNTDSSEEKIQLENITKELEINESLDEEELIDF